MTSALLVVGFTHLVLYNAFELQEGKAVRSISLEDAAEIVERMVSEEDEIATQLVGKAKNVCYQRASLIIESGTRRREADATTSDVGAQAA